MLLGRQPRHHDKSNVRSEFRVGCRRRPTAALVCLIALLFQNINKRNRRKRTSAQAGETRNGLPRRSRGQLAIGPAWRSGGATIVGGRRKASIGPLRWESGCEQSESAGRAEMTVEPLPGFRGFFARRALVSLGSGTPRWFVAFSDTSAASRCSSEVQRVLWSARDSDASPRPSSRRSRATFLAARNPSAQQGCRTAAGCGSRGDSLAVRVF